MADVVIYLLPYGVLLNPAASATNNVKDGFIMLIIVIPAHDFSHEPGSIYWTTAVTEVH